MGTDPTPAELEAAVNVAFKEWWDAYDTSPLRVKSLECGIPLEIVEKLMMVGFGGGFGAGLDTGFRWWPSRDCESE